jgi:hypothetical protein
MMVLGVGVAPVLLFVLFLPQGKRSGVSGIGRLVVAVVSGLVRVVRRFGARVARPIALGGPAGEGGVRAMAPGTAEWLLLMREPIFSPDH